MVPNLKRRRRILGFIVLLILAWLWLGRLLLVHVHDAVPAWYTVPMALLLGILLLGLYGLYTLSVQVRLEKRRN